MNSCISPSIEIKTTNSKLKKIINNYTFIQIPENFDTNPNQQIIQNINRSNIMIVNQCIIENQNDTFFIIGLKDSLILIKQTLISILFPFFPNNNEFTILFLPNTKDNFNKHIEIRNRQIEIDHVFLEEISNFNQKIIIIQKTGSLITEINDTFSSCITGYLIYQSYLKTIDKQMIDCCKNFQNDEIKNFDVDDFIELRNIGYGSVSSVELIYEIESGELFAIKKINSDESEKLFEREYKNYLNLNFQFLPKLIGKVKGENYLIIQFIKGQTLNNISQLNLTKEDKIQIILDIMIIISYFHENGFVYRDLKPNNIIIDEKKQIFIIDFDRMIKLKNNSDNKQYTFDFQNEYAAPEIGYGKISYTNDIYSIGQMIFFILNEKNPCLETPKNCKIESFCNNESLLKLYKCCTNENLNERHIIYDLILELCIIFDFKINIKKIKRLPIIRYFFCLLNDNDDIIALNINEAIHFLSIAADLNHVQSLFKLSMIYYTGKFTTRNYNKTVDYLMRAAKLNHSDSQYKLGLIFNGAINDIKDIDKAIFYYTLAANQNHKEAQLKLGNIYYEKDVDKAIYFYLLAANQNSLEAQVKLGNIYYENQKCIDKAIFYFTLAANQNHKIAQYWLGIIFSNGKYIKVDTSKAVHYFTLAADQGHKEAQFELGMIYLNGSKVKMNINKAFYYLTLSASQNYSEAQYNLALIYFKGKYIKHDIYKSIHYFTLAAENNHLIAQYYLGVIYICGYNNSTNINKSIHYLTLAANQNYSKAQYILGVLYYENKFIARDIRKSVYYLTLAANQNEIMAQFQLGKFFYEGIFVTRDINRAIHYFEISSNQNSASLCYLGNIYFEGKYIKQDINLAIYYYSIAADKNDSVAQCFMGLTYYDGIYIKQDINKALHYLTLSAKQKNGKAYSILGLIYEEGKYVQKSMDQAIYYYTLAANQNEPFSQYNLGHIYYNGEGVNKDPIKGINFFILSSMNGYNDASFIVGYFYHEGVYLQRDINKVIHFYKQASSFYNQYAKNNLGVIYLKGFGEIIPRQIGLSMSYFHESITQKNDAISMYNLSHIYIYEFKTKEKLDESIDLLVNSAIEFRYSLILLCIALIKKFGFDLVSIKNEIKKKAINSLNLADIIIQMICEGPLLNAEIFQNIYEVYYYMVFVYNYMKQPISLLYLDNAIQRKYESDNYVLSSFFDEESQICINCKSTKNYDWHIYKEINDDFYEGFGLLI